MNIEDRKALIASTIARMQEQLDALDSLPAEPQGETCIVYFEKTHGRKNGKPLSYAAIKLTDGMWQVTRVAMAVDLTWSELLDWIRDREPSMPAIWLCTNLERLTLDDYTE